MRHALKGRKFNRNTGQRTALLKSLVTALVKHEQIKTTLPKAKDLRPIVEKLVTVAKENTLANRRYLLSFLNGNDQSVERLLNHLGPRFKDRAGGYTRILKAGFRHGDMAPMAVIEFIDRDLTAKGTDSGPVQYVEAEEQSE
jgi:large subunit ribosomal protein L17